MRRPLCELSVAVAIRVHSTGNCKTKLYWQMLKLDAGLFTSPGFVAIRIRSEGTTIRSSQRMMIVGTNPTEEFASFCHLITAPRALPHLPCITYSV